MKPNSPPTSLSQTERSILIGIYQKRLNTGRALTHWLWICLAVLIGANSSGFLVTMYIISSPDTAGAFVAALILGTLFLLIGLAGTTTSTKDTTKKLTMLEDPTDIEVLRLDGKLTRKSKGRRSGTLWVYYVDGNLLPEIDVPALDNKVGEQVSVSYIPALGKLRSVMCNEVEENLLARVS